LETTLLEKDIGHHPLDVYGDVERITQIFHWFTGVILFAMVVNIFIILLSGEGLYTITYILICIPFILSVFFFIRRQNFEVAAVFLAIILFLLITFIATKGIGIHHLSNLGFPAILIVASLVTRKRTMVFLTLFAIGCAGWLVFGELAGAYTPDRLERSVPGDFFTTTIILITTAFMVRLMSEKLFESNRQIKKELTERKLAETQKEELIRELEAKNAELERFTYTVSHDLKSPLVTINGFLGYLENDTATGNVDRVKQDTHRIQEAVNKMHSLLNELLELSRIGRMANPSEKIPFDELVQDALKIVHGRLDERNIKVVVIPNLPSVYGDRQRLIEILQNLVENATKYIGDQPEPRIEIGQEGEEDGKPIFYVRDNGIGIDKDHHERIFGLFNKLDAKSEGTGIGLTLVKRIIEVHGGRIWVESQLGKGATFYFTLPKAG